MDGYLASLGQFRLEQSFRASPGRNHLFQVSRQAIDIAVLGQIEIEFERQIANLVFRQIPDILIPIKRSRHLDAIADGIIEKWAEPVQTVTDDIRAGEMEEARRFGYEAVVPFAPRSGKSVQQVPVGRDAELQASA